MECFQVEDVVLHLLVCYCYRSCAVDGALGLPHRGQGFSGIQGDIDCCPQDKKMEEVVVAAVVDKGFVGVDAERRWGMGIYLLFSCIDVVGR